MKVLVMDDKMWELARSKILAELDCAQTSVMLAKAYERMHHLRHYNMSRLRKRRLEATRLAKLLKQ